jgi:hypothetical protein
MQQTKRKKRSSSSPPPTKQAKRRKSIDSRLVASMMQSLQSLLDNPSSSQTDARRQELAVKSLEEAGDLSQSDFVDAVGLIQEKASVATAYLAIQNPAARTLYIQKQLEKFRSIL